MLRYILLVSLAVCGVAAQQQGQQIGSVGLAQQYNLTLNTWDNGEGGNKTITQPVPDLGDVSKGFFNNDVTKHLCGVGGWLLYDRVNYTGDLVYGFTAPTPKCETLPLRFQDKASSVRLIGTGDLYQEAVTFYDDFNFNKEEYLVLKDEGNLLAFNNRASSLIITGQPEWTFYRQPNFGGEGVCLTPRQSAGSDVYFSIVPDVRDIGLQDNEIASIRKGCQRGITFNESG